MQIPLHRFEQYVGEVILERGFSYYKNKRVTRLQQIGENKYEATVEGTDDYTIEFSFRDGIVSEYSCDCPFTRGPVCKHLIAVFFHLQEDEGKNSVTTFERHPHFAEQAVDRKTISQQAFELLEKLSQEELKNFVHEKIGSDPGFRNAFLSAFAQYNVSESKELYNAQIKSILYAASDKRGYIKKHEIGNVNQTVSNLLITAKNELKQLHLKRAFYISAAVAEEMIRTLEYVDQQKDEIYEIIDTAFGILKNIAQLQPEDDVRETVLQYCFSIYEHRHFIGWGWHINSLSIASDLLKTTKEIAYCLDLLENVPDSDPNQQEAFMLKQKIMDAQHPATDE